MLRRWMDGIGLIGLLLLAVHLAGCATTPDQAPVAPVPSGTRDTDTAAIGWWYVRFRHAWPNDAEPLWHRDLLIADRIVRPALDAQRDAITLWRFHRRAARDGAGHQFSFIFRTTPTRAARLYDAIRRNPTLARMQRSGWLESVRFDDLSHIGRPGLGDTSDPNWSRPMQIAWPAFIMGVSGLWLELIAQFGQAQDLPRALDARYRAIDASIDALWRAEGGHALLHHLNALFGYRPVVVTTRAPMRF